MRNGVLRLVPRFMLLGALALLAGCATYRQPVHAARPAAHRRAAQPAAQAVQVARSAPPAAPSAARATAAADRVPASEPAEDGPRSAVPLAGFRPMRGQSRHNP